MPNHSKKCLKYTQSLRRMRQCVCYPSHSGIVDSTQDIPNGPYFIAFITHLWVAIHNFWKQQPVQYQAYSYRLWRSTETPEPIPGCSEEPFPLRRASLLHKLEKTVSASTASWNGSRMLESVTSLGLNRTSFILNRLQVGSEYLLSLLRGVVGLQQHTWFVWNV